MLNFDFFQWLEPKFYRESIGSEYYRFISKSLHIVKKREKRKVFLFQQFDVVKSLKLFELIWNSFMHSEDIWVSYNYIL